MNSVFIFSCSDFVFSRLVFLFFCFLELTPIRKKKVQVTNIHLPVYTSVNRNMNNIIRIDFN